MRLHFVFILLGESVYDGKLTVGHFQIPLWNEGM